MMKKAPIFCGLAVLAVVLGTRCSPPDQDKASGGADDVPLDTIMQVSSYNGLLAGLYDPVVSYADLAKYGDTGLGTFDRMDGEMLMIDGKLLQIAYDGTIHEVSLEETTPYATLVNFRQDGEVAVKAGISREDAQKQITAGFENSNLPHAVIIRGTFKTIKCRSIQKQEKRPYQTIQEISANQSVFDGVEVKGTMVGFFYPQFASALNVPGFHMHFVSDDMKYGGHVLDYTTGEDVVAELDRCEKLVVYWPDTEDARKADMNQDRSDMLQRLNRGQ